MVGVPQAIRVLYMAVLGVAAPPRLVAACVQRFHRVAARRA